MDRVSYIGLCGTRLTAEYKEECGLKYMEIRKADTNRVLATPLMRPHEAETFFMHLQYDEATTLTGSL